MRKKTTLFLMFFAAFFIANAQTTYYWVGGSSATWGSATWSTTLGGALNSGTRSAASDDILIIDGSNLGGGTSGAVTISSIPIQTIGNLMIQNAAAVTFSNSGAATLTIGGTSATNDFTISSNSSLQLGGTAAITIAVATGAKGLISGAVTFNGSSGTPAHKITSADAQGVTFSGANAIFEMGTASSGSPFNTTAVASNDNVVFASGSVFRQVGGGIPFGATAPASVVQFQSSSKFSILGAIGPNVNSRTYADVEYNNTSNLVANITPATTVAMDNLTITSIGTGTTALGSGGSSANLNLKGNVQFNHTTGTFTFGASNATLAVNFVGTSPQTLSGNGTVTITNSGSTNSTTFNVKNGANLTFNRTALGLGATNTTAFTVETGGRLNMTGENTITGSAATFNLNSGATLSIGSVGGISGSNLTGNIRTATQTYSTGANYIYTYQTAGGITGAALPATVNNFTLATNANIGLTNNLTVGGNLALTEGSLLSTLGKNLTVNTPFTLTDNTTISLNATAHTINIAASNGASWASGKILTINGWQGDYNSTAGTAGRIYVGSNSTGLTTSQLESVRFLHPDNSQLYTAAILPSGEVVPAGVLSISLSSFTVKAVNKSVILNWSTSSEKNNNYFEIKRSANGKSFVSIGKVMGAGNSSTTKNYSFIDESPEAGTNYYKLVQHDFDNATSSSDVKSVNSNVSDLQLAVVPNDNELKISIVSPNQHKGTLKLFDLSGRTIKEQSLSLEKGYNSLSLPVNLQKGVYVIMYSNPSSGSTYMKFTR